MPGNVAQALPSPPVNRLTWAVVGATGFVGTGVMAQLGRSPDLTAIGVPAPRLRAGADDDVADLIVRLDEPPASTAVAALAQAFAAVDVVINAAGIAAPGSPLTPELFGANALLPAVIARAAARAGVRRVVHISSAAVQDRREPLDETPSTRPVTPYAVSKSRGEAALARLAGAAGADAGSVAITIFRATSIHGPERAATQRLARFAASRLATVAGAGDRPTPIVLIDQLTAAIEFVGRCPNRTPLIVLAPWTGTTTASVLRDFGRREPAHLPTWLCRLVVATGYLATRIAGGHGRAVVRRIEVLWLGQSQVAGWLADNGFAPIRWAEQPGHLSDV